jgi:predicted HTH domain antitoxin
MMAGIVNLELLDDELKAVVQAGGYGSEKEAVGHALEVLLWANPHLRTSTAVELYRQDRVTLARAAEIAGLGLEAFKEKLAEHGVPIRADEPPEEIHSGADLVRRLREAP